MIWHQCLYKLVEEEYLLIFHRKGKMILKILLKSICFIFRGYLKAVKIGTGEQQAVTAFQLSDKGFELLNLVNDNEKEDIVYINNIE